MIPSTQEPGLTGCAAVFPTTHWSVVVQAVDKLGDERSRALERLCESYWYPLYAYVRRKGHSPADAEDLTQEFFARLLHKNYLSTVDQRKGRFRSFLLASLEHFLAKEWNRAHRVKRGGRCSFVSFDDPTGEERYQLETQQQTSPEMLYDRTWALAILTQTMQRLAKEYSDSGKPESFGELKSFLSGDREEQDYAQTASRLGLSEGATRVAVHRLRARYGELLREIVAETLARPEEVEEEILHLLAALGT